MCRTTGLTSWERSNGSIWVTVANGPSYTTSRNLSVGQYTYRCVASNVFGVKASSNNVTVIVYGK